MKNSIFRKIPVARPGNGRTGLKRNLGVFDLVMMGIGVTIGSGLFVITGVAAAEHAGPAWFFPLGSRELPAPARGFVMRSLLPAYRLPEGLIRLYTRDLERFSRGLSDGV